MTSKSIFFSFLTILALSIAGAEAATITVGPEGCDHVSIQAAIEAASPGDVLVVAGGTYSENLVVDRPLVLQGAGNGTDRPIVDADGRGSAVTLVADGVRLEGFVLENGGFGWAGIDVKSNYNQIRRNLVTDNRWYGIFLDGANGCLIEENVVLNNKYGIWINLGSDDNRVQKNVLQDNENYNAFDLGTNLWEGNFYGDYDGFAPLYEVAGIYSVDHSPSGPEKEPVVEEASTVTVNVTEADRPKEVTAEDLAATEVEDMDSNSDLDSYSAPESAEDAAIEADLGPIDLDSEEESEEEISSSNRALEASTFWGPTKKRISIKELSRLRNAPSLEEEEAEKEAEVNESAVKESIVDEPPEAADTAVDSYSAEDWAIKGDSLGRLGRYSEAASCYDRALVMDPELEDAWNGKGDALLMTGRYDRALRCYERALEIEPDSAEIWYNQGNALQMLLQFDEALACYDEALRIEPGFAEAWNRKGMTLNRLGRYEEALDCFDEAIVIEPGYSAAWSNKSWALQMLGEDDAAKEAFDRARALGYG